MILSEHGEKIGKEKFRAVRITKLRATEVCQWYDGSRAEGVAASATAEKGFYLGRYATVMDAELN